MLDKEEDIKKILKQLVSLRKEIIDLEKKISETEPKAFVNDKVRGSSRYFPYSPINIEISATDKRYQLRLLHLKALLQQRLDKCIQQETKAMEFINNIEDSEIRQILELRYVNDYSWVKIGMIYGITDESVKKKVYRFFKRLE